LLHFIWFIGAFISDWDLSILAWIALVPLFVALTNRSLLWGFLLSYVHGMLFLPGVFNWILQIPYYKWYHHALLGVYLGAYFGLFGLTFVFISKRLNLTAALWSAPFLWVSLEYIRSNFFFLALPWGLLGHTQYRYPVVIQIAALFGTYGVSFLIVLVNAALMMTVQSVSTYYSNNSLRSGIIFLNKQNLALGILAVMAVLLTLFYGRNTISRPITGQSIDVALVQGNIAQSKKWDPQHAEEIMQIYSNLTLRAAREHPALIIWPETATPGLITFAQKIYKNLEDLVRTTATPLVLGSARHQKFQPDESQRLKFINSAFLMAPRNNKIELQRYSKIRLFPFGEYLPVKSIIPWKLIGVSSLSEYVSGKDYTVFELSPYHFGVTICWENIFPGLVRQFALRGAQFIVNITNEARFGKTAAPHQLLTISVFWAVENGMFIIRCANTGVSCIIDSHGRIIKRLQDENGQDLFVRGILNGTIIPTESKTFYTRNGDLIPILAIAVSLVFIFTACLNSLFRRNATLDTEG